MIKKRYWALVVGGLAVVALFLLAAALPELTFKPGRPFALGLQRLRTMQEVTPLFGGEGIVLVFRIIFTIGLILFPISIIYMLISPERRKRFLRDLLRTALFMLLFYLLFQSRSENFRAREFQVPEGFSELPEGMAEGLPPLPEFTAEASPWLVYGVSLLLAVVVTAIVAAIAWSIWKHNQREEGALDALVQEAQDALDALQAGGDLKDVVMRCYFEMTDVLRKQRGIQRGRAMTTREFEERLVAEGLPGAPVRQLTRLFEAVRYGDQMPGKDEERQAMLCLSAIVNVAGGERKSAPAPRPHKRVA